MLRAVVNIRAKSADYIVTHLDELGPQGFAPAAVDDADSNAVNTQQIMCLPARYVGLLLNPAGYTVRQVWETLHPAIVDANDLQVCQPLITWLRAASTGTVIANQPDNRGPPT
jgi:hypothetical protein